MRADEVRDVFESVDAQPSAKFSDALLAQLRADFLRADLDASRDTHDLTIEPILIDVRHEEPQASPEQPNRPWSRRRIAVGLAALAVIVGAIVFVRTESHDGAEVKVPAGPGPTATTNPPPSWPALPDGLKGLPPEGATPSTPETGQLLGTLPIPIWVYEDGRVISARWTTGDHWTGFLEQRLTPEGIELVRAEMLALKPSPNCRNSGGYYGYGDGGRIVCEQPRLTPETPNLYRPDPQYERLSELQFGAKSWLPTSAWLDPQPKPYVPSMYQVQIVSDVPIDAPAVLAALPPQAAQLLTVPTPCPAGPGSSAISPLALCFNVRTEEARQVATAAGITGPTVNEQGRVVDMGTPGGQFESYWIRLLPYLPHNAPVECCWG